MSEDRPVHQHHFTSDQRHHASYTPLPPSQDEMLQHWWRSGLMARITNPTAMKLLLYMLHVGRPCAGGWFSVAYTDDDFRLAAGVGERGPWVGLRHLMDLGIVVENSSLPGAREYRLLPASDWPISADQQLALGFGPHPGEDEAAKGRSDSRQGDGRRGLFDPRERADVPFVEAHHPHVCAD